MNWTNLVVIGLLAFAGLFAFYQSQKEGWAMNRKVGTLVFLVGAAIGLFLDDFLSTSSALFSWVEPIAAAIMLLGLSISWVWQSEDADHYDR